MSTDTHALWAQLAGDDTNPLVVLSHGSMDRSAGMLRLSRRLDEDFAVLRYDRRGYGRSVDVGPPFTLRDHVEDLASVIESHAPGRRAALVFGHSFGGNVALGLADQRPDLVDAVAVYETPLSWLEWWPGSGAGGAALAKNDPAHAAEAFMRRLVGDAIWERLPGASRDARRLEGAAMVAELTDLRRVAPWNAQRIHVPVLAACGELARPHHRRGMAMTADLIEHARFAELDGAGHGAPNSHPGELAALLKTFVNSSAG